MYGQMPAQLDNVVTMNKAAKYLIALALIAVSSCLHAEELDTSYLSALQNTAYHEWASAELGRSFHLYVSLPDDYVSSSESYPTVYLLDGDVTFPLLAAYHRYLRFGDEVPAAILVGISYGSDSFENGNMRSTDFTAPSAERDFWGGAAHFQNALQQELLAFIEKTYRSDPDRRIIFGQSIGGQFVLYSALTEPGLFFGRIASNPALHRNLPFFLGWHGPDPVPTIGGYLFVSSGEYDDPRFREPALEWIGHWQKAPDKPWALETQTLSGQSHFSAAPVAYRNGLKWIFSSREQ